MSDRQAQDDPPTRVVELVVNLDDITGELVGDTIDRLIQGGALDAWATPIIMKKGRPGLTLSVLANETDRAEMAERLLRLTGSFGVRVRSWDRLVLERAWFDRPTRLGSVKLKAGTLHGQPITVKPEFEDVARLASAADVTVAEAQRAAAAAADGLLAELRQAAGGPSDG